jgi:hypothetical protein
MTAFVRVSGPPNSNFLVGYPGISATLVSFESSLERSRDLETSPLTKGLHSLE